MGLVFVGLNNCPLFDIALASYGCWSCISFVEATCTSKLVANLVRALFGWMGFGNKHKHE